MEFNLADLFESVVDAVGDREALTYLGPDGDTRRLTYSDLDAAASRIGHHLLDSGVKPGEHVGLYLYNGVEYLQTLIGCLKARAVPVNINYRYLEEELAYLFDDADLVTVVYDAEFADRVAAVAPRIHGLRNLIQVGGTVTSPGTVSFEDAEAAGSPERGFEPRSADDQFIIYTGGTTGMPKGVMWRQEDLFFAGMGGGVPTGTPIERPQEMAPIAVAVTGLVYFPLAPLMHGTSTLATCIAFNMGQRVVLQRRFDPTAALRAVPQENVNTLVIVGDAMARPLAETIAGNGAGIDMSSVFIVSSSGAILSEAVRAQLQEVLPNAMILDNFGSTESGFNGTATAESGPERGFRVEVNGRTCVVDETTHAAVGTGGVGRIAQRGHVPLGYYGDDQKTADTFFELDGERWVLLGDMGRVEEDGTVTVLGRGSQCINTGGEKVYPEEIEAVLKSHPAIFDATVTGVPDDTYGHRVAAIVQVRPDTSVDAEEVQRYCRTKVAGYKLPRVIVFVEAIRRSPSGKADYPWARELAARHVTGA